MDTNASFSDRLAHATPPLSPAEQRVAEYVASHRERAIMASAVELAEATATSDATVIRTARRLGFSSLNALRRALANDLQRDLTLAERLENSLERVGELGDSALTGTLAVLREALDQLESGAVAADFAAALDILCATKRVLVFGIGPSGFMAGYFAGQIHRLGGEAMALQNTGLRFADDVLNLRVGDCVIALAYDHPYPEITALFDRATELALPTILITSPSRSLPEHRAHLTLPVPRGQSDGFSLHAATMALLESLIVGYAGRNRQQGRDSLERLNRARQSLTGKLLDL